MKQGSITVFCAISMMLIVSFLFALLEAARMYGLDAYARLKTEAGADSVCAEFQPLLWEQYGLLALDGAYGTNHFSIDYVKESLEQNVENSCKKGETMLSHMVTDLFRVELVESKVQGYALFTDDKGELFLDYVAEREKEALPLGIAESLYEDYQKGQEIYDGQSGLSEAVSNAEAALTEAKNYKWNLIEAKVQNAETEEEEEAARAERAVFQAPQLVALGNLLKGTGDIRKSFTLDMILEDSSEISGVKNNLPDDLWSREKQEGTMQFIKERDWYRKTLVLHYLENYFSNYLHAKDGHYLRYELEYVLCGRDTDWKNLEETFNKILFAREVANITYLLKDKEKLQEAEYLAQAVGLLIGENPAVVKVIQAGIVAAWAYAESILDVRALVRGMEIPLVKNGAQWTTEMEHILTVVQYDMIAKECNAGWRYIDYMKQLLYFEQDSVLAYRMLEVMEMGLRSVPDYSNCRMNQMLIALQCQLHFEVEPLFFSLMTIGSDDIGIFHFEKEAERCYIP